MRRRRRPAPRQPRWRSIGEMDARAAPEWCRCLARHGSGNRRRRAESGAWSVDWEGALHAVACTSGCRGGWPLPCDAAAPTTTGHGSAADCAPLGSGRWRSSWLCIVTTRETCLLMPLFSVTYGTRSSKARIAPRRHDGLLLVVALASPVHDFGVDAEDAVELRATGFGCPAGVDVREHALAGRDTGQEDVAQRHCDVEG